MGMPISQVNKKLKYFKFLVVKPKGICYNCKGDFMNADTIKKVLTIIVSVLILLAIGYIFIHVAVILFIAILIYYVYKKIMNNKNKAPVIKEAEYKEK